MGAEDGWQDRALPWRRLQRRHWQDRDATPVRRSRLMLMAGGVLMLAAMLLASYLPQRRGPGARPAIAMAPAVIATAGIGFGEKLTAEKLKLIAVPARSRPSGHFTRIDPLIMGEGRTALRPIIANEILIEAALVAGSNRLSTAPLLRPGLRAMAVRVTEVTGVSGLVYPGDRVDVLMTRQPEAAMPHAELVAQDLRVLAVGSDMNIARDRPGVEKTVTLELNPLQAQKLTLAATSGTLSLALRQFSDERRVRLPSLQVSDLNDGTPTRLVKKPASGGTGGAVPPAAASRSDAGVIVMRGSMVTAEPVLR